jgi:ABC-2 type transport system permease protein
MIRALHITLLQTRIYLTDRADLAFSLLLPIAIFALSYGAFGGQDQFHGTAHVVNEDRNGVYSTMLVEQLEEMDNLKVELLSASDADRGLDRADLLMVIFIPEDFSSRLAAGERAQLVFKQRGNGGDEGQIVASIVAGVAEQMAQDLQVLGLVSEALQGSGISPGTIEIAVQGLLESERRSPTVAVREETVGATVDPVTFFLPGILTMFVLFAITMTARALVEERKKGTLERLLTSRLRIGELFFGKFLANFSRGFIQTLILLLLSYAVFQLFTPLSFLESLVVAIVFIAAASSLGLIMASVARTEDQAVWVAVVFTMIMVILGGTFFEIPESGVMNVLSKLSVNTYANDAFKTIIAEGGSLGDAAVELGVLAGVAVVGLFVARYLFRAFEGGR